MCKSVNVALFRCAFMSILSILSTCLSFCLPGFGPAKVDVRENIFCVFQPPHARCVPERVPHLLGLHVDVVHCLRYDLHASAGLAK